MRPSLNTSKPTVAAGSVIKGLPDPYLNTTTPLNATSIKKANPLDEQKLKPPVRHQLANSTVSLNETAFLRETSHLNGTDSNGTNSTVSPAPTNIRLPPSGSTIVSGVTLSVTSLKNMTLPLNGADSKEFKNGTKYSEAAKPAATVFSSPENSTAALYRIASLNEGTSMNEATLDGGSSVAKSTILNPHLRTSTFNFTSPSNTTAREAKMASITSLETSAKPAWLESYQDDQRDI
jgi:hypothetical protein